MLPRQGRRADPMVTFVPSAARRTGRSLDGETLPATALRLGLRIAEDELGIQTLPREVDLGALDDGQALGIDDHLESVRLEDMVVSGNRLGEIDVIRPARATRATYAEAQADRVGAASEKLPDASSGGVGQRDRH